MPTVKRKWSVVEHESDEDEPALGRQILPVANLPNDFDGEPQDGMQYLFTVRRDARQLPHVTRVANPYAKPEVQEIIETGVHHHALPSEDWYLLFNRRYKNLRKQTIGVGSPVILSGKKLMPGKKERDNWWAFITGLPECEWIHSPKVNRNQRRQKNEIRSKLTKTSNFEIEVLEHSRTDTVVQEVEVYQIDDEGEIQLSVLHESSDAPFEDSAEVNANSSDMSRPLDTLQGSSTTIIRREPTPMLLNLLDNRFCLHLLMYFDYWMKQHLDQPHSDSRITDTHGRWIFALLARVEENISADDTSLLRTLTRTCLKLIKKKLEDESSGSSSQLSTGSDPPISEAACWMVVAAVSGFWRQTDLWTEAGHMFSLDH